MALHRPDIHGGNASASMAGMIAAIAVGAVGDRNNMQGGPGIFWGDIRYYFIKGLRNGGADGRGLTLPDLSSERRYDLPRRRKWAGSCRTRQCRPFRSDERHGSFSNVQNPALFREYSPVLERILSETDG